MYRESIADLIKWKESPRRKPLIIEGAPGRQNMVGQGVCESQL